MPAQIDRSMSDNFASKAKQGMQQEDISDLLDDALNDFQPSSRNSDAALQDNIPAVNPTKSLQPQWNPLPKRVAQKSKTSTTARDAKAGNSGSYLRQASSSNDAHASSGQPGSKKSKEASLKGKGLTPLPAQKGKKAKAAKAGSSTPENEDAFAAQLGKLMQELAVAEQDAGSFQSDQKGSSAEVSDTLRALSQEAARLQTQGATDSTSDANDLFNEPMFAGLRDGLQPGDGGSDAAGMGGLADALMRQLLSKDVLQQPLQEIGEQYPGWLEKNRERLSAEETKNYEQQYHHIQQILQIYANDPNNYSKLFSELHQMQQCGQPPDEIVKELAPGMSFDGQGIPGGCCIQ